ncbi:hypothetical protein C8R47DRAFT_994895 [Mycena vitilis]|nr:hypothetical protein C8R47DRAFT_994895 [Mycena vitilis]
MSPSQLGDLFTIVKEAAALHEERNRLKGKPYNRLFHLGDFNVSYPDLSVKYNDHDVMESESITLELLSNRARKDGDAAPHVPRWLHYFAPKNRYDWGYMVMERVAVREVPYKELCAKTADAVRWLHAQCPPPMKPFGSLGGHYARHTIFKNTIAPTRFKGVAAADMFFDHVIRRIGNRPWNPAWSADSKFSLADDDVVFTQSDMDASNFGVDTNGRPVIFDAATIQALPVTLADFTLLRTTDFAKDVAKHVFNEDEEKLEARLEEPISRSLASVRNWLYMYAESPLGQFCEDCLLCVDERIP